MSHYKISKSLNDSIVSKFVKKKWVEVNDLSSGQYSVNKNISLLLVKTLMLRSGLCDYSDAYIVVKGIISLKDTNARINKKLTFKKMHLDHAYQNSMTSLLTMQKIFILLCQCIIC